MVQACTDRLASFFARVVLGAIWGVCCCSITVFAIDAKSETEFLEGLRSRGLYRLVAMHAEGVLARDDLSDAARIEVAIHLSRSLADWGHTSQAHEREERWQRAHTVLHGVLANVATHPRAVLLELQDALLWLGEGDLAKEEAVLTNSQRATATARQKLRTAIGTLQSLAERLDEALQRKRMARLGTADSGDLSIDELTSLRHNVALEMSRALISQAEVYPADSPDRINALTRAADHLTSLLQRVGDNDLRRKAELELVVAYRLLGHFAEAKRLLESTPDSQKLPVRAAAEKVRLLLAEGYSAEAVATAARHREQTGREAPELLLAHLEALVADGLATSDRGAERQAVEAAMATLAELKREYAPRWGVRGELWLARLLAATNQKTDTVATARLAAEGLYRAGRMDAAIEAFDRAIELARQQENPEATFELAMTAAAVVQQNDKSAEAARRYVELANQHTSHPRAAEAHRLGILATADAARTASSPGDPSDLLAEYVGLLEDHLAKWPDAAPGDEVRVWIATWRLQNDQADAARRSLREVSRESEHYDASRRLLMDTYERLVASSRSSAEKTALANQAAHELQPVITGAENRWPTRWTPLQQYVALVLARLQLAHVPDGARYAERLLSEALAAAAPTPDDWRHQAIGVLLAAHVASGQLERAEQLLAELATAPPEVKTHVAGLLTRLQPRLDPARRKAASELALRILDEVHGAEHAASEPAGDGLEVERARALTAAGRRAEALDAYRNLVQERPNDFAVHEEYARLLAASDERDENRRALQAYQLIERRTRPGGERWVRARTARIQLLAELGERADAEKLLKLTQAVHPEVGQEIGQALQNADE